MKLPIVIAGLAVVGGMMIIKSASLLHAPASASSAAGAGSGTAAICKSYAPRIWEAAKRAEPDMSLAQKTAAFAMLQYAGTAFCDCIEETFGTDRFARERELLGLLSGAHLVMKLAPRRPDQLRQRVKLELKEAAEQYQDLLDQRAEQLRDVNAVFRQCKKAISLRGKIPASIGW